MTYEEFKLLAEHPQHRDVPAIFKLEVLETEELEEKKRSHYPKYKVNTYCPQAFTTNLEEAERLMHAGFLLQQVSEAADRSHHQSAPQPHPIRGGLLLPHDDLRVAGTDDQQGGCTGREYPLPAAD